MSKKNVLVQSSHVIFDDAGHPMSQGEQYSVNDSLLIERLISENLLTVISEIRENEPREEVKKNVVTKNSKTQETELSNLTGEL